MDDVEINEIEFNAYGCTGRVVFDRPVYMPPGDLMTIIIKVSAENPNVEIEHMVGE